MKESKIKEVLFKLAEKVNSNQDILAHSEIIDNGIGLLKLECGSDASDFKLSLPRDCMAFLVPVNSKLEIESEIQQTSLNLIKTEYGVISHPFADWFLNVSMEKSSTALVLVLTIKKVHQLLELNIDHKLDPSVIAKNYRLKKFVNTRELNPNINLVFQQLFSSPVGEGVSIFYKKAKVLEFLSLYMEQGVSPKKSPACPVVHDNLEIEKIKRVESILKENMSEPPSIPVLSKMVGTNELKLKTGFKQIYGKTVYGYLMDYRMDSARLMLNEKDVQIKDVAFEVGYSNPSHFIAAFKKKFGVTPKQYLREAKI